MIFSGNILYLYLYLCCWTCPVTPQLPWHLRWPRKQPSCTSLTINEWRKAIICQITFGRDGQDKIFLRLRYFSPGHVLHMVWMSLFSNQIINALVVWTFLIKRQFFAAIYIVGEGEGVTLSRSPSVQLVFCHLHHCPRQRPIASQLLHAPIHSLYNAVGHTSPCILSNHRYLASSGIR